MIPNNPKDKINPDHYKKHPSGIECIAIVEHMDYLLGNVIKYVWRYGETKEITDLEKAAWYLDRKIKNEKRDR